MDWKKRFSIPDANIYNYQKFDEIGNNKDIDVVYVVLPNAMHKEYTIRAAKAGKHVICEKPMGINVKECREMIEACKKAGVQLAGCYESTNNDQGNFKKAGGFIRLDILNYE